MDWAKVEEGENGWGGLTTPLWWSRQSQLNSWRQAVEECRKEYWWATAVWPGEVRMFGGEWDWRGNRSASYPPRHHSAEKSSYSFLSVFSPQPAFSWRLEGWFTSRRSRYLHSPAIILHLDLGAFLLPLSRLDRSVIYNSGAAPMCILTCSHF